MLIGILSDSHGRVGMTRRAVQTLTEGGAEVLVHLGDVESDSVLDELAGYEARVVFGNCDFDEARLRRYAERLDIRVDHPLGEMNIGGRTIAYTHGHLEDLMKAALDRQVDFLLHGHSHEIRDERIGATRIINPGALFRARRYTAALLNPVEDRLAFLEIPRDP